MVAHQAPIPKDTEESNPDVRNASGHESGSMTTTAGAGTGQPDPAQNGEPKRTPPKINKTRAMLTAQQLSDRIPKSVSPEEWSQLSISKKCAHLIGLKFSQDFRTLAYMIFGGWFFAYSWIHFYEYTWYEKTISVLLLCFYGAASSIMTHNVMHNRLFYNRYVNKLVQFYLSCSFGAPVSTYVPAHNLSHHAFPNRAKDTTRTTLCKYEDDGWLPGNFWNMILAGYIMSEGTASIVFRYMAMMGKRRRPYFYQAISEVILYYALFLFLLYKDWRKFLFLFHIPHEAGKMFMMAWNFIQHDGTDTLPTDDANQYDHPNNSRNLVGPFFNALFFNNGYHSVHHLHQTMHWTLLPAAHRAQFVDNPNENQRIDPRLNIECLLTYIWKHMLTKGNRVRYDGKPVDVAEFDDLTPEEAEIFELAKGVPLDDNRYETPLERVGFLLWALPLWFDHIVVDSLKALNPFGKTTRGKMG